MSDHARETQAQVGGTEIGDHLSALAPTRKEATWLACRGKTCCHTAVVVPTGRDVWRISRALDAPPWTFLVYFRAPTPASDTFQLTPEGPPLRLAFAKQVSRRRVTAKPCIFLLRTRDGAHRCSLGALRPGVCRGFPARVIAGLVQLQPELDCTCRRWALADLDLADEMALIRACQAEAAEYAAVVADWNSHLVETTSSGATIDFLVYCRYLLEAYDQLAFARDIHDLAAAEASGRSAAGGAAVVNGVGNE